MHDNLIHFLRQRPELFPFRRDLETRHFLTDVLGASADLLPVPAKIFLLDELEPKSFGFPLTASPMLDELEAKAQKWLAEELKERMPQSQTSSSSPSRPEEVLAQYREAVGKVARNAETSSILADYHSVFWLYHTQQVAKLFTNLPRQAGEILGVHREESDRLKYVLHGKWTAAMREELGNAGGFFKLVLENPFLASEDFISTDLRELRSYFAGQLRRDFAPFRAAFESLRNQAAEAMREPVFRRAMTLLGYPDTTLPVVALLDPRVRQLLAESAHFQPHPDIAQLDVLSRRLVEYFVVHSLRRGILWMKTTEEGDNIADDGTEAVYSRAIRPMNFGRRGVVEPIVYRYGLVYDITSFTQTLGEIARGGKAEEQTSYRQMLEFQRELAEITRSHGLQFEKFLGDGAFYTSRRATRAIQAAVEIQQFYSRARAGGFAFNKGMRIALNYGYYRLLPMQVSTDGSQIMEFYGPGIVELSRLTTGKATKELEDIQHLLLSHGYDQAEVYKFFAPLSRSVGRSELFEQEREFYAYVNESGHLVNEGCVVSIPFLKQLSLEMEEDNQKIYRLRTPWSVYVGFPATNGGYLGMRILGNVSLKGIGTQEIGEVVRLAANEAEVSVVDDPKSLLQLLQQERNRSAAHDVGAASLTGETATADLVVCESHAPAGGDAVILVGEWDPVSEEVRRPIQLHGMEAERYGLNVPLTAQTVESQSVAYQKLYRILSRIETLPNFSVGAIRDNANFSGFIIGATVEPL